MTKNILIIAFIFLLVSCLPVETKNPVKAYKYWSGNEPPKEIEIMKGEYYQSPHFSLEYELFLKFKSEEKWFKAFVDQNQLKVDTIGHPWANWTKLPKWFKTDLSYSIYGKDPNKAFERSRYFRNPQTGICYIYETVGM